MGAIKLREPIASGPRHYSDPRLGLSGTIIWDTVTQREINNCPLPAILAAIAKVCPRQIHEMVSESRDVFESHFADEPRRARFKGGRVVAVRFPGLQTRVRISPLLYYRDSKHRSLRFASAVTRRGNNVWVSYIEKAYVAWPARGRRDYETLDFNNPHAPSVNRFMFDLAGPFDLIQKEAGKKAVIFLDHDKDLRARANKTYSLSVLRKILRRSDELPTIATTWSDPDTLRGLHTYVIETLSGSSDVKVWEPLSHSRSTIKIRSFWKEFDQVLQARRTSCS